MDILGNVLPVWGPRVIGQLPHLGQWSHHLEKPLSFPQDGPGPEGGQCRASVHKPQSPTHFCRSGLPCTQ